MTATPVPSTAGTRPQPPSPRRNRPVLWWAAVGALFIAFQAYVYTAWIASDDFRKIPTGEDPVPQTEKVFAWILQPLFMLLALAVIIWVVRGCRREERLTLDAKLLMSGTLIVWMDPIGSWIQPQFFFNSYYVNMGTWVEHIPGWYSPGGRFQSDLLLVEFPLYTCLVAVAAGGCAWMRWLRSKRPQTSTITLILSTWALVAIFVMVFEEILILRTGVATWEEIFAPLTIYAGTRYEMSFIPDPAFWGGVMVFMICLRYFQNDRGETFVEVGLERVEVKPRVKSTISALAVIGAVSAAMALSSVFAITASLYSHTPDNLPSYLQHGMCGKGTDRPCPDAGVPIQRKADR